MTGNAWHGELVRLRAIEEEDWPLFGALWSDTEATRAQWIVQLPRGEEALKQWAKEQASLQPPFENDNWHWVIETHEGVAVGEIMTTHCNRRDGVFDYGIGLLRAHWGRGYALDAARLVLRYYFGERRYEKANATVAAFNAQSQRLQEKLGMQLEGRRRSQFFTDGTRHDELLYGITAAEFFAANAGAPR
ncbi:MAG: GNAT family N-acetyltransferase [Tepidiformaceae bacterium]